MKKILLLVSLSLSLVYLGCKGDDGPTDDPPAPTPPEEQPLGTGDPIVAPDDVDLDTVAPTEILPCELTTKQFASQEELVQAFEQANCVVNGDLDQNCLNRHNYENCYKARAPSPSSSSVVTCTSGDSAEERSFTFNTYSALPGEGLLCDVIDDKDNMLFYARNQSGSCRSMWSSYKAQQGYRCSDDPPEPEPAPEEVTTEAVPEGVAGADDTEDYTITNQAGVTVTVDLSGQSVDLAEDDCVQVSLEDFNQLAITADADKNVCELGSCEVGDYTVEAVGPGWQFLWKTTEYSLIPSSPNPTCGNTL